MLAVVGLYITNQYSLHKQASLRKPKRYISLCNSDGKSSGVSLILCPFNRIIVVASALGPRICLVVGSCSLSSENPELPFREWALDQFRKWFHNLHAITVLVGTSY